MNFSLQGESEIVGYWHASRRLHNNIRSAPIIYSFVDHCPLAEMYEKKAMSELSPWMLKLFKELMEYPFHIQYMPGRGSLIGMVDALSRSLNEDTSTL